MVDESSSIPPEIDLANREADTRSNFQIGLEWFTELDNRIHTYLIKKFPKAIPRAGKVLRWLYAVLVSPAFAVVLAFLLAGFVISGEVTIIVSASAFCAWLMVCLSITKIDWVNNQRIGGKMLVLVLSSLILFAGTRQYVNWCLRHYSMNKAKDDEDKAAQESERLKTAFREAAKSFPIQQSISTIAPAIPAAHPPTGIRSQVAQSQDKHTSSGVNSIQAESSSPPSHNEIQDVTAANEHSAVAQFFVTQSTERSDRPSEPNEIRVVVQTNVVFPTSRLAVECDGPISDGDGGVDGKRWLSKIGQGYKWRFFTSPA